MYFSPFSLRAAAALLLAAASGAAAGEHPLLDRPSEIGDRPCLPLEPAAEGAKMEDRLVEILDREDDPLVRMETIRRAAAATTEEAERLAIETRLLRRAEEARARAREALTREEEEIGRLQGEEKADPGAEAPPRAAALHEEAAHKGFDLACARAMVHPPGSKESDEGTRGLRRAALELDEPAVWLAIARAVHPLAVGEEFRQEHAHAFLQALRGASGLKNPEAAERLKKSANADLESIEARYLDPVLARGNGRPPPDASMRLRYLDQLAASDRRFLERYTREAVGIEEPAGTEEGGASEKPKEPLQE